VTTLQAQTYAKKHDMMFYETSAKNNYNVNESFTSLSKVLIT